MAGSSSSMTDWRTTSEQPFSQLPTDWRNDPPYSVRRLRQAYLNRIQLERQKYPPLPPKPRQRPFHHRTTSSLPFIEEVEEERRSSWTSTLQTPAASSADPSSSSTLPRPPPSTHPHSSVPPPPSVPPPLPTSIPPELPKSSLNRHTSKSQLLYPPGSTEHIASEKKPAERPPEKTVYENRPVPPQVIAVNIQEPERGRPQIRQPPPARNPEEDYPERLMSPPPTHQPKSILKQAYSSAAQYYEHKYIEDPTDRPQTTIHTLPRPTQQHVPPMRPSSATFQELSEEERYRIMQENLQRHRQSRATPTGPKPPVASFNGPFFKLEEISPRQRSQSAAPPNGAHDYYEHREERRDEYGNYSLSHMRNISASEVELTRHNASREGSNVVVWPPITPTKERSRPASVAKNLNDPERIEEYKRQKRLEDQAIKKHEHEKMRSMEKQIRAIQIQQQRLYEQRHGVISPVPIMDSISPQAQPPHYTQQYPQQAMDPNEIPQHMRVFETRPISAMSDTRDLVTPGGTTWKRTYIVEKPDEVSARNEILTSEEILEREQYEVDLLKRREAFVEKPDMPPEIHRVGKRWQPPPDKPYVWPTLRRPISVEPSMMEPIDFAPGVPRSVDDGEYKWAPVVSDPGFKKERKNFTPTNSPPASPRRGHGTGPLDEPAKRQTKYVIQPSPDGSHRPKPAFRKERHTPAGSFYPHAPNAIKVVKKRHSHMSNQSQGLLAPTNQDDVQVIHQRNYHRLDQDFQGTNQRRDTQSEQDLRNLPDWEKIYELPPHSSQIVSKEIPRHVDVRRRLSHFEGSIQNLASARQSVMRAGSIDSLIPTRVSLRVPWPNQRRFQQGSQLPNYPMPDYDSGSHLVERQSRRTLNRPDSTQPRNENISRRNSLASTRVETSSPSHHHHNQRRSSRHSQSGGTRPQSRTMSAMALSPQPRADTPAAQKARAHIARATAPSPIPVSYERARAYLPPGLPPGYRAANQPPKTDELDELGRKSEELLERSRERRAGYKLMESDIVKEGPEPVPQAFKDQIREMLESRNSVDTATQDRSGYVTDVSTATWQFSQHSFSPRSIVSVNGARDDIMKQRESIWPFLPRALPSVADSTRTSLSPAKGRLSELRKPDRFNSMPLLSQQLSTAKMNNDDRPRGIMKRKELETKDQMMWPAAQQQVVEHTSYNRSVSNVAKPTVTETVQRFEETKRTEEVERRVQRREKKERRSRHHSSSRHHSGYNDGYHHEHHEFHRTASMPRIVYKSSNRAMNSDEIDKIVREAYEAADEARRDAEKRGYRSSSLSRGGHAGYLPATNETYYRREATRREHHTGGHHRGGFEEESFGGRGLAHARYGSLSDSLRRGELKYVPNGDVKEGYYRDSNGRSMHKSHSTRDVFSGGDATYDHRSASSMRRGSQQNSPFIEYPPSLPRRSDRSDYYAYKPVSKSRSYADWDDAGRAGVGKEVKRYDDDMSRLEAEFRDSLLMPMPNGNLNEKEHRTEQLPGGYETYSKDNRANSGRRVGRDGRPVDFNEATQEYSYKREQEFDDRRRR